MYSKQINKNDDDDVEDDLLYEPKHDEATRPPRREPFWRGLLTRLRHP